MVIALCVLAALMLVAAVQAVRVHLHQRALERRLCVVDRESEWAAYRGVHPPRPPCDCTVRVADDCYRHTIMEGTAVLLPGSSLDGTEGLR